MGGYMKNNTTIISIYQQGSSFVGFNNEDEIVMLYSIADPVLKAKTVLQWTEEGRFKGSLA
jgi:hypothetical protein